MIFKCECCGEEKFSQGKSLKDLPQEIEDIVSPKDLNQPMSGSVMIVLDPNQFSFGGKHYDVDGKPIRMLEDVEVQ